MRTGLIERIFEVINLLRKENERLQKENALLRIVLNNLISELPEEQKKEINSLTNVSI